MIKINPDAIMGISLGFLGLMNAIGKKPPEALILLSLLGTVYGIGYNLANLVEKDNSSFPVPV